MVSGHGPYPVCPEIQDFYAKRIMVEEDLVRPKVTCFRNPAAFASLNTITGAGAYPRPGLRQFA